MLKLDPKNVYALVIGNNKYERGSKLPGAEKDVDNVYSYLTIDLRVSPDHVHKMIDAKRVDIIAALQSLAEGKLPTSNGLPIEIPNGSAVVIFYSGHGGQAKVPKDWNHATPNGKVEQILPVDVNTPAGVDRKRRVKGIPDRTIAAVLNML